MRTTLTLDPDVVQLIENEKAKQRKSFKQVVNDAIRRGLAPGVKSRSAKRFRVEPHRTKLRPGIDVEKLNQLTDEMEDEAILGKVSKNG